MENEQTPASKNTYQGHRWELKSPLLKKLKEAVFQLARLQSSME